MAFREILGPNPRRAIFAILNRPSIKVRDVALYGAIAAVGAR
jgi:hypothetical protein